MDTPRVGVRLRRGKPSPAWMGGASGVPGRLGDVPPCFGRVPHGHIHPTRRWHPFQGLGVRAWSDGSVHVVQLVFRTRRSDAVFLVDDGTVERRSHGAVHTVIGVTSTAGPGGEREERWRARGSIADATSLHAPRYCEYLEVGTTGLFVVSCSS